MQVLSKNNSMLFMGSISNISAVGHFGLELELIRDGVHCIVMGADVRQHTSNVNDKSCVPREAGSPSWKAVSGYIACLSGLRCRDNSPVLDFSVPVCPFGSQWCSALAMDGNPGINSSFLQDVVDKFIAFV